jgi:hypothetical protein
VTLAAAILAATLAAQPVPPPDGPFGTVRLGFSAWRASMEVHTQAGWSFGNLMAGISLEVNPFIDLNRPDMSAGAFGFGAFLAYRPRLTATVALRFEVMAGGAVLLFDTYGYRAGDVGLWLGARVMGLDLVVSEHVVFLLDVVDMVLPAFRLATMPFIYPEWRWSVGLAFR